MECIHLRRELVRESKDGTITTGLVARIGLRLERNSGRITSRVEDVYCCGSISHIVTNGDVATYCKTGNFINCPRYMAYLEYQKLQKEQRLTIKQE